MSEKKDSAQGGYIPLNEGYTPTQKGYVPKTDPAVQALPAAPVGGTGVTPAAAPKPQSVTAPDTQSKESTP